MKRFKRPISEVAKGMFHGGSEGPIIPNLGVNSKKPAPTKMTSPAKDIDSEGRDRPLTAEQQASDDKKNKESILNAPKGKSQSEKNTEARKSGKAVSYKDAYADADKSKYKTYEEFEKAAKSYNTKKYGTTNPTADAKEAGKTKEQLAKDVASKQTETPPTGTESTNTDSTNTKPTETKAQEIKRKAGEKANEIATRGNKRVERIKARKAKRAERKESRVENRAERKESRVENKAARQEGRAAKKEARQDRRAKVKAARKGEEVSPAKSIKKHSPLGEAKLKKKKQADKRAAFAAAKGGSTGRSNV